MSKDYDPHALPVAPSANIDTVSSGAGDYGSPVASTATVGADSASFHSTNKFATIGHDQTDAAAIAAALPNTINVNGSVVGSGTFDSSGVANVIVAAPKP